MDTLSEIQAKGGPKKLSLIAFSGDFDKLTAVFTLATGAAAVGYEVNIFFTFWGLDAIKRKEGRAFLGKSPMQKLFGFFDGRLAMYADQSFQPLWPWPPSVSLADAEESGGYVRGVGRGSEGIGGASLCLRDGDACVGLASRRFRA